MASSGWRHDLDLDWWELHHMQFWLPLKLVIDHLCRCRLCYWTCCWCAEMFHISTLFIECYVLDIVMSALDMCVCMSHFQPEALLLSHWLVWKFNSSNLRINEFCLGCHLILTYLFSIFSLCFCQFVRKPFEISKLLQWTAIRKAGMAFSMTPNVAPTFSLPLISGIENTKIIVKSMDL